MNFRRASRRKAKNGGPPVLRSNGGHSSTDPAGKRYECGGHQLFSLKPVKPGRVVTNARGGASVVYD